MRNWKNERGSSLVVSLLAVTLLSALGAALVMTSNTELMLSAETTSTRSRRCMPPTPGSSAASRT